MKPKRSHNRPLPLSKKAEISILNREVVDRADILRDQHLRRSWQCRKDNELKSLQRQHQRPSAQPGISAFAEVALDQNAGDPGPTGGAFIVQEDGQAPSSPVQRFWPQITQRSALLNLSVEALRQLPADATAVISLPLNFIAEAIERGWPEGWEKSNGIRSSGDPVGNWILWRELLREIEGDRAVRFLTRPCGLKKIPDLSCQCAATEALEAGLKAMVDGEPATPRYGHPEGSGPATF